MTVGNNCASLGSKFEPCVVLIDKLKLVLYSLTSSVCMLLAQVIPAVQLPASRL